MPRDLNVRATTGPAAIDRKTLFRLLQLLWPRGEPGFRLRFALTIGLLAGAALLNALVPLLFAAAVDHLSVDRAALAAPLAILVGYVVLQWLSRILNESRWALYGPIDQRLQRRLALRAIEHLHDLSLRFHLARRTGEISRILDNGLKGLRELVFDAIFLILPFVCEIIFVAATMLVRVDVVFAAILLATLLVYGTVLAIGSEWLRAHQRRAVVRGATAHGQAVDSLLNYETIKYFNREELIARRYDGSLAEVERLTVKSLRFRSTIGVVLVTVIASGMAAMLLLATVRVGAGTMTIGELVLVNTYLLQLVRPMERLGQLYRSIKQSLVDLEQLRALLEERPEVVDRPGASSLRPGPGAIAFERVSFHYGAGRGTLEDVSFTVAPGRKVAIVGPTGAGKSSIARLLFRFYDPSAGRILIDGQDISRLTQASVRAAIGVVPQEAVLFNDTIGENIALARPDARPAEIDAAASAAALKGFIEALPDGYATLVGERGLKLSGGEKQRIAIARAILKRPRIFIFDEATSALDSATEQAVQANLAAISEHTTTIVIAHRLSTIVTADEILVLDRGRIVERGDHATLVGAGGLYADLWRRQAERPEAIDALYV
ncbi:MAG TPA: ABC transporter ATP-binding protein/permease [Geminicoccaceae bacterium]|nr:ABC transporter ATP-binding protein/permease [Geminicoccaceae bacterium]